MAGVLDACSRRVVGWAADAAMPTGLVARAFERAVLGCRPAGGLLYHSDRGSQHASDAYRELLRHHGATPSLRRPANCYDNARTESFWATLKGELIGNRVFATRAEAETALFDYIEVFYNRKRLHCALGFQSPVDYENNLSQDTKEPALRRVHFIVGRSIRDESSAGKVSTKSACPTGTPPMSITFLQA